MPEEHREEITRQVQSAIAPLTSVINSLRTELGDINTELAGIRKDNLEFRNLIIGAKFLGDVGSIIIKAGAIIAMLWGLFTILTKTR